jgi:hypothetical protein
LNLSILPATFSLHTDTVCNSYTMNGQTYYQSGTYKQTLAGGGSNGCDSVIIMQLVIYPPAIATLTETVCGSYTLNGQTYTTSGNYSQTLFNASATGCDSIIVLDLTILPDASSMQTVTACNSYTWNGQTYTASGTYTQVFPSSLDCDSTVTLQLTLTPVDASVTYVNETLTATMPGATYQWIECSGEAISGATAQEFHATANGSYAVIVTSGNCTDTSDCVAIFTVGLEPSAEDIRLTVYPNPGNGIFYIFSENLDKPVFEIYDLAGKYIRNLQGGEMLSTYSVNISDLAKGTYLLRITDRDKTFIRRIILR